MKKIKVMRAGRPATQEELQAAVEGKPLPPVSLLGVPIESGVPVPDLRGKFNLIFAEMSNGESFMVSNNQQRERALMAAKRMGHKATSLKVNGAGYRVWLVSKAT